MSLPNNPTRAQLAEAVRRNTPRAGTGVRQSGSVLSVPTVGNPLLATSLYVVQTTQWTTDGSTGAALDPGYVACRVVGPPDGTVDVTKPVTAAAAGNTSSGSTVYLQAPPGGTSPGVGTYVAGVPKTVSADGYVVYGPAGGGTAGLKLVTLASDGGSDGYGPSTYASWTYTVKDYDTGAVLGTKKLPLISPRMPVSGTIPAAYGYARGGSAVGSGSSSGSGSGSGGQGSVLLVEAAETYGGVDACTENVGSGSGSGS